MFSLKNLACKGLEMYFDGFVIKERIFSASAIEISIFGEMMYIKYKFFCFP